MNVYVGIGKTCVAVKRGLTRGAINTAFRFIIINAPKEKKQGIVDDSQFGPKYFKVWWDRACKNLGVEGVDLYDGTKHTVATALGQVL